MDTYKTIKPNGTIIYRDHEHQYHRDRGPAVQIPNSGVEIWYQHGQMHRVDGPAYVNNQKTILKQDHTVVHGITTQYQIWYQHGLRHRENGPAFITNYSATWFHHGELHNLNGPAVINFEFDQSIDIELLANYNDNSHMLHQKFRMISCEWVINRTPRGDIHDWCEDQNFTYPLTDQQLFELKLQFF